MVTVETVALEGIGVVPVAVQAQIAPGLPAFIIVGLADKAVAESRERVRAALFTLGMTLPAKRILINLSPADLQKEGSHYDVPIALAVLAAMGVLSADAVANMVAMGELGLDGTLRRVQGALPTAMHARSEGKTYICPADNGAEAAWAAGAHVVAAPNLMALVRHVRGEEVIAPPQPQRLDAARVAVDLAQVRGQALAKRALEIVAAGGHNLLMSGPPGAGKSMLSACLPGLLPPLTPEEMLEVSMIASVAGTLDARGLATARPFRDPHHSTSVAAMVGGGKRALPGEISLAHRGVLFMDEFPEFPRAVLEALRQPLESGSISIARAQAHVTYPAQFQLIAAMNPCRCGYLGDAARACSKAPRCAEDYQSKLSGPLLDRIDVHIEVQALDTAEMLRAEAAESSAAVRARVEAARHLQAHRAQQHGLSGLTNATLKGEALAEICAVSPEANALLHKALEKLNLSMRAYTRTLKVARTIADLAQEAQIGAPHVAEALGYRQRTQTL